MSNHSDSEDELPVFDFLQPAPPAPRVPVTGTLRADPVDPDADGGPSSSSVLGRGDARSADAVMIGSDSDEDAAGPHIPLAQRLQRRRDLVTSAKKIKEADQYFSSSRTSSKPLNQNCLVEPELPVSLDQLRAGTRGSSGDPSDRTTSWRSARVWGKPAGRTAATIQDESPVSLKAQDSGHKDKETLKVVKERKRVAKTPRPEPCISHMVVQVDPALLQQEGGGTLLAALQALGCSCAIEKQPLPRSVSWMRKAAGAQSADDVCVPEDQVVMEMTVDDFITLIHSYIQGEKLGRPSCGPTLTSWVQAHQRCQPAKILSLVVIDLEKYFRCQKSESQRKFRDAITGEEHGGVKKRKNRGAQLPEVSRIEVEEAVVHLQLHTGVGVRFLSAQKDFSHHIAMTSKAIAEAPFKRERQKTSFSFYLESEWAGGHRVDKAGAGLLQVWRRQIQQLNRVSPDMASAILAAYPSPQLLRKAYKLCKTEREKSLLLSDLLIRRGQGVTSTTRRVGPELSKRLYLLMNSCDAEQTLDSSV
ncbi:crossover junction endonuclease EME1 [Aulostomus maculatus]